MKNQSEQAALLERIGGANAVQTLVGALYFNILNDPRLAPFFAHVSLARVMDHQRRFLEMALAGDIANAGPEGWLAAAHRQLIERQGLREHHFDALLENLVKTLQDLAVPVRETREVVEVVAATRGEIFGQ